MRKFGHLVRLATAGIGVAGGGENITVRQAAIDTARLSVSDEEAAARLREKLRPYTRDVMLSAAAGLSRGSAPSWYLIDRARRLIDSVVCDKPVRPIAREQSELFLRQAKLGRLSMAEAYRVLMTFEPALGGFYDTVESWHRSPEQDEGHGSSSQNLLERTRTIRREARKLVGPKSKHPDQLVRSNLALDIVQRYLYAVSGYTELGTGGMSYFEAPNVASGMLGGI
jgi:hypothetical protein